MTTMGLARMAIVARVMFLLVVGPVAIITVPLVGGQMWLGLVTLMRLNRMGLLGALIRI